MKRFYAILAALLLAVPSFADEGMWLLPLIEKMNKSAIYSLGGRLSPEEIYSINHSSIKDAVVQFGGGCTGELISDKGLLVTNHHCGYGSIQSVSTPEHNYLEDGFWAMSAKEEIPIKGLTVRFLQSMTDVTAKVAKGKKDEVVEQAKKANPHCDVQVVSFYNDNVFYLIVSKVYRDVRFVGAPPASSGKFGGDTDNWMWPRHTCDFSMFRVYAGNDNEPADYSENNVPMKPRKSLEISLKGVQEGDFAMIMGYPGRTQRFQTAAQLKNMLAINEIRIAARSVRQDVMWKEMRADDTVGLQYANKYAGSSNGWKKWIGMREAFAKLDILGREQQEENEFMAWVGKNAKRSNSYGSALETIESVTAQNAAVMQASTLLQETLLRIEVLGLSRAKSNAAYRDYNADVDKKIALALVEHYLANVKDEDRIDVSAQSIEDIFANSVYTSAEKKNAAAKAGSDLTTDPAAVLVAKIIDKINEIGARAKDTDKAQAAVKAYTAGLLEWKKGEPSYPDANSTCRLTYGNVKSYSPKDGVLYRHFTTLKGVMEKEDPNNYEFRVPAKLKEIYNNKDYGQYADANGQLVTCFLTNLDITGGNSGSPVLNADGQLIGLAFDGNWESMSSDVMFEPDLQRCICVDIRYVLLMMDKFGGAGYLLDEMKIAK